MVVVVQPESPVLLSMLDTVCAPSSLDTWMVSSPPINARCASSMVEGIEGSDPRRRTYSGWRDGGLPRLVLVRRILKIGNVAQHLATVLFHDFCQQSHFPMIVVTEVLFLCVGCSGASHPKLNGHAFFQNSGKGLTFQVG